MHKKVISKKLELESIFLRVILYTRRIQ